VRSLESRSVNCLWLWFVLWKFWFIFCFIADSFLAAKIFRFSARGKNEAWQSRFVSASISCAVLSTAGSLQVPCVQAVVSTVGLPLAQAVTLLLFKILQGGSTLLFVTGYWKDYKVNGRIHHTVCLNTTYHQRSPQISHRKSAYQVSDRCHTCDFIARFCRATLTATSPVCLRCSRTYSGSLSRKGDARSGWHFSSE